METISRYTPGEVLEIFKANYLQYQQFNHHVEPYEELTFETTIEEWRNICDLLNPYELAESFNYYFELNISIEKWLLVLEPEEVKNLGDICKFISENAVKPLIKPVKIFGSDCQSAATFKYLMNRFNQKGIMTAKIQPSSLVEPFAKENLGILIAEVNKINPAALPPVKYRSNYLTGMGEAIFLLGFIALVSSVWMRGLFSMIVSLIGLAILLTWLGLKFGPTQVSFEGINTFRDLIERIHKNEKANG